MSAPDIIAVLAKNSREQVRVALNEYRGHKLVDIRVMAALTASSRLVVPTKKVISVSVDLLPALVRALQDAEARARALGLIGGAS